MWKQVGEREVGKLKPHSFANRIKSNRISSLQLSNHKEIVSAHRGAVNSLQVDLTDGRYLLAGASDGSAAVYDIQCAARYEGGGLVAKHESIFVVDKQHEQGHKYAVSSAVWYPIDTGLFVTGSFDHYVNVWDTNTTQVVMNFKMPGKVYRTAMSSVAKSHMLIATGTEDVQVRLCDIASGAFTHTLSGHRGKMMVSGSTSNSIPGSQSSFPKARMLHKKAAYGNGTKHTSTTHKNKGSTSQRLHPGMLSSHDRATAHYGAVIGLKVCEDSMYLLSAGSDSRLRLWDIESGCNTLVNFEATRLQTSKGIQLAVTQGSSLVFVPCMSAVKAFDVWSGRTFLTFRGHYENVNCCWFSSQDQELYTGSNDRQILVWSPSRSVHAEVDERGGEALMSTSDQDNWSD
ncbi:hypothetical protein IFM89_011357 [Coptis chinensis]|uniref:Transducin/WD40 repeat-like superfamily protein n=1 Tax=Coptis chinensis TaxID=261450 RepID=A0A835LV72_9MAGN|nr:hypothetical protein IFM89_011357 [Coptis chinensis]